MEETIMGDPIPASIISAAANPYSRKNPYLAELIRHEHLTQPGSEKDTRHFVLNLADSGLTYTPGDSLGVFGRNSPMLVDEIISLLGFDPHAMVKDPKGQPTTLRQTLLQDFTLNRANRKIMAGLGESHIQITAERMARKYGVNVGFRLIVQNSTCTLSAAAT